MWAAPTYLVAEARNPPQARNWPLYQRQLHRVAHCLTSHSRFLFFLHELIRALEYALLMQETSLKATGGPLLIFCTVVHF